MVIKKGMRTAIVWAVLIFGLFMLSILTKSQRPKRTRTQSIQQAKECNFVASRESFVFHRLSCDWAKKIKEENKVYFHTFKEAVDSLEHVHSYRRPCAVCKPESLDRELVYIGHNHIITSVAFSPNGNYILSGSRDKTVRLWESSTGEMVRVFSGHTDTVTSVGFSHGKRVFSSSLDKTVRNWDMFTAVPGQYMSGSRGFASAAYSVDDCYMVISDNYCVRVIDFENFHRKDLRERILGRAVGELFGQVLISPDSKYVATSAISDPAGDNGGIMLWELATGELARRFGFEHRKEVAALAFSPDSHYIASGSYDHTVKLWDVATGNELRSFLGHTRWVSSVAFSPDGLHIVSGSWDKTLKLWSVTTGKEIRSFSGHTGTVQSVAYSPDGRHVLSGSSDETIRLWDVDSGKGIRLFSCKCKDLMARKNRKP